ncbi:alpha/beta fold hydrolase [Nocardiopsis ansamitocini]|nr:alpha/beta fold hydrolase [Nocardiopsis ansamitocini]
MSTLRQPGLVMTDHTFTVPLDHAAPDGATIEVYAREVVAPDRETDDLPWLLFLQGGPGCPSPRPIGAETWLGRALGEFRVLLLDQRGTGRSTPVNRRTLAGLGDPTEQAAYLGHFRADSIVRDAELIRHALIGEQTWSVLGQSFGGFCATTYLSIAPEGLREVFITGGLPGLQADAATVYRATYPHVAAKTAAHYARYPDDAATVKRIAAHLRDNEVELPGGGRLTVEAFQALGQMLGRGSGSHSLHYLLEDAFADGGDWLSDAFLTEVKEQLSFASTPLYAALHEAIYAQGAGATDWAAHRVRTEFPSFAADADLVSEAPLLFTGEMIYPWQFELDPALRPLRAAADLLAARTEWPSLYDAERLATTTVPVAAAVYHDDMYVDAGLSLETAAAIKGCRVWVTNEWEHDGLRASGGGVLDRLIAMARGAA